ncbi:MAG: hypothetical protein Q8P16_01035 [bacterium]|nr:hypothetical protein [bacterium]
MNNVTAVRSTTTAPAPATTRPPCPFYGFVGMGGMFVDNHGNACGAAGGHRPCSMKMDNETPDWNKCVRFNNDKNRETISQVLDQCKIFPDELLPPNTPAWDGVSLRGWFQLIMRK